MSGALSGKRIVITRPEAQAQSFIRLLQEAGAIPIIFPTIEITPLTDTTVLDAVLNRLSTYDWVIFTSVNGVRITCERLQTLQLPLSILNQRQIAVIGPATAATLRGYGLIPALQPGEYIAEAILESLAERGSISGQHFLLLRADIARAALRDGLIEWGAQVDEVAVYHTIRGAPQAHAYAELRAGVDVITFTSSSTVQFFCELLGDDALSIAGRALIACIGPITAQTAREKGLRVDLIANEYTITGLLNALLETSNE